MGGGSIREKRPLAGEELSFVYVFVAGFLRCVTTSEDLRGGTYKHDPFDLRDAAPPPPNKPGRFWGANTTTTRSTSSVLLGRVGLVDQRQRRGIRVSIPCCCVVNRKRKRVRECHGALSRSRALGFLGSRQQRRREAARGGFSERRKARARRNKQRRRPITTYDHNDANPPSLFSLNNE
jgi:hypothetical protein